MTVAALSDELNPEIHFKKISTKYFHMPMSWQMQKFGCSLCKMCILIIRLGFRYSVLKKSDIFT